MRFFKLFIICTLLIIAYSLGFLFSWGWIISLVILILFIIVLFLPKPWGLGFIGIFINYSNHIFALRKKESETLNYFPKQTNKKVALGLSGGVDSAVSVFLLQKQGYEVRGFFMRNWDSTFNMEVNSILNEDEICQQEEDYNDALKVAKHFDIELERVDFVKEYWDQVFSKFLKDIKNGLTPNPDIMCNRAIKFNEFTNYIFKKYPDISVIATGHYAKISKNNNNFYLKEAKDTFKDQTYFLSEINKEILSKTIFPLGDLKKDEVREIAKNLALPVANKKDSTGICFIGKRNFPDFMSNYLKDEPGNIVDKKTNKVVGKHRGVLFYTLGQRKGLNLGGMKEPYYVCEKNLKNNILYVSSDSKLESNILYSNIITTNNFNLLVPEKEVPKKNTIIEIKVRHAETKHKGRIEDFTKNNNKYYLKVKTLEKIKAVTPGQEIVLYKKGICLGGGQIV